MSYIKEAANEHEIDQYIRYNKRVESAHWSSKDNIYTLKVRDTKTGKLSHFLTQFVWSCTGYYNYDKPYIPKFEGIDDFDGDVVHPQFWPDNYDHKDKKILVIGSGATAISLVPSLADKARHITMLQRSPTYVFPLRSENKLNKTLRKFIPEKQAYKVTRFFQISFQIFNYQYARRFPRITKRVLNSIVSKGLKGKVDIRHFRPHYKPWDERLCAVPDGDLFKVLREGKASVVTDHIEKFTSKGVLLKSGDELDADLIITATGMNLLISGGTKLYVDNQLIDRSSKLSYKGLLLEDVPNMIGTSGYTNASFTLKADLVGDYFCRLLNLMDKKGKTTFVAKNNDASIQYLPIIGLKSGYVKRGMHLLPKQGDRYPWKLNQNYFLDYLALSKKSIEDNVINFGSGDLNWPERESLLEYEPIET